MSLTNISFILNLTGKVIVDVVETWVLQDRWFCDKRLCRQGTIVNVFEKITIKTAFEIKLNFDINKISKNNTLHLKTILYI